MKNFLSTTKGKIIAGAVTFAVIAAAIVLIVLLNTGYRSIQVADLNGSTKITSGLMVSEAFKGQNLQSNTSVSVSEKSDLTLALDTDKHVYAKELTKFKLEAFGTAGKDSRTIIHLEEGSVLSKIDEKLLESESYVVDSPNATMAVRGTTFTVTVSYDAAGLCHTSVEVEKGTVEVIEKDENGFPTDNVQMLNAGDSTEVISEVKRVENPAASGTTSSSTRVYSASYSNLHSSDIPLPEVDEEDADAVADAIVTYLNGGELDTTNFDRVTKINEFDDILYITLDGRIKGSCTFKVKDVNNIDFLMGMTNLNELTLRGKNISDISPLQNLKNLKYLVIHDNNISDISPLQNLTNLTYLNLSNNQISDLSPLKNLTNLSILGISNNKFSDLSPLKNLTNLTRFAPSFNEISDISIVKNMTKLTKLDLNCTQISDLSPLQNLTNLTELYIGDIQISDISPLLNLTNLTILELVNNEISDISPLQNLTNLKSLNLRYNQISDISPLQNMTNLSRLNLENNQISDISPLQNLTNLNELFLCDNNISDISPLQNLTNLYYLDLTRNLISHEEIESLKQSLPHLHY